MRGSGRAPVRGVVAVISGPEGIGRTRLAAELAGDLHREGVPVLHGAEAIAQARGARRPTLLVLDEAGATGLTELAPSPVLALAITTDPQLAERLGVEHVALRPLGPAAIEAIAALYAPEGARVPVADLADRSGGMPRRAHRLAAEWARAEAAAAAAARGRPHRRRAR